MTPKRIQRKRTKGFHLPPNTLCVCRPRPWGNPFDNAWSFRHWLSGDVEFEHIDPGRRAWMLEHLAEVRK